MTITFEELRNRSDYKFAYICHKNSQYTMRFLFFIDKSEDGELIRSHQNCPEWSQRVDWLPRHWRDSTEEGKLYAIIITNEDDLNLAEKGARLIRDDPDHVYNKNEAIKRISYPTSTLDTNNYQYNSLSPEKNEILREVQQTRKQIFQEVEKICQELAIKIPDLEKKKRGKLSSKMEDLAKNIYLNKVQQTLQELNECLEKSGQENKTVNDLKKNSKQKLKTFLFLS